MKWFHIYIFVHYVTVDPVVLHNWTLTAQLAYYLVYRIDICQVSGDNVMWSSLLWIVNIYWTKKILFSTITVFITFVGKEALCSDGKWLVYL